MAWYSFLFGKTEIVDTAGKIANTVPAEPSNDDYIMVGSTYSLPDKVELKTPPIRSQGATNSCMSHAAIRAAEIQWYNQGKYIEGSERYHYYNARVLYGTFPDNVGMTVLQGCHALYKYSMAVESLCPWSVLNVNTKPGLAAYWMSTLYEIDSYERVLTLEDIKDSLANGIPVVCGVYLNSEYYKLDITNYVWSPKYKMTNYGGHAQTITGYDEESQTFKIDNSWGTDWGYIGTYRIPYESFSKVSFNWYRIIVK